MTRPSAGTCPGAVENGPGKRYAVCRVCGRIDWEKNEGDRCGASNEPRKTK